MTLKNQKVSFRAEPALVKSLDKLASAKRMNRSQFLQLLLEGLANDDHEKDTSGFEDRLEKIEMTLGVLAKQISFSNKNSTYFSTFASALASGVVQGVNDPKRLLESAKNAAQARIEKKPEVTK